MSDIFDGQINTSTDLPDDIDPALVATLEARFGNDQTGGGTAIDEVPVDDEEQEEVEEEEEVEEPEPQAETPPPTPDSYTITLEDGSVASFSVDDLKAFHSFQQRLNSDPGLYYHLASYNGQPTPGANPQTQTPAPESEGPGVPDDIDLEDPTVRYLYEQNKALADKIESLTSVTQTTYQSIQQQQEQAVAGLVNTAKTAFAEKYKLDEKQTDKILDVAGRMGAAASYMNGIDPRTGAPVVPNAVDAVQVAMEMAMWSLPEFRENIVQEQISDKKVANTRKRKLTALSGNSGSSPRNNPAPTTPKDRRAAMVQEIAADMGLN